MNPFSLNHWRRVHKPFVFIFLCALCLLGLVEVETTRFETDSNTIHIAKSTNSQNVLNPNKNVRTMNAPFPTSDGTGVDGNDFLIITSTDDSDLLTVGSENIFDENLIPVLNQLPFCNPTYTGEKANNGKEDKSKIPQHHAFGEDGNNETSDKIVLPNTNRLNEGRLILVATLDGHLTLMNHGGRVVWTIGTGHFFSSTISTLQITENGRQVKLIPSLTGGLYKLDGDSLHAIPLNADSLLKRSFKLANDVVITGGKEMRTFGVDIDSGKLRYECGMEGCSTSTKAELKSDEGTSGIVLVVKKQLQIVRAVDSLSGSERWNFSVANHELALAGVTEGCHQPAEEILDQESENTNHLFKMLIPEGIIFGADAENKVVWQHKFESPISQAWTLEKGRLRIVDPILSVPIVDEFPSLYVGIHKQQLYVQESHTAAAKIKTKLELAFLNDDIGSFNRKAIEWKPATINLLLPGTDNTALATFNAQPFFVYDRDETAYTPAIEAPPNYTYNFPEGAEDERETMVMLGLTTLWFWWKEILGISLLTAVILNILLLRPIMRFVRRETVLEMTRFFRNVMNREQQGRQALLPRTSTSEESIPSEKERIRTASTSSSQSQRSAGLGEDQIVPFNSQYLREFDPIQCLGRGGFGVVFEARKKIDDRNYAVKRIALPSSEKSRDRVMREVKALAKLDHKNIVRYFNAWIENPPKGWLEKSDPLWNCGALSSPSPTCDYPSYPFNENGRGDSLSMLRSGRIHKKDHFEITVPKTPDEDDSFIVFTTDSIDESCELSEVSNPPVKNRSVSVCIGKDSIDSWASSEKDSNSHDKHSDSINSLAGKFFARPTTLDIPSDSNSWGQDADTQNKNSSSSNCELSADLNVMYLYIQQELCQKRTLQEWLRAEKQRNLRHVVRIFAQIVEAVEYIHSHNLIHRDLKPSNIFLTGETGQEGETTMTAKIGDFGLATTLVPNKLNEELSQNPEHGDGPEIENAKLTGHVGTHLYMSPEQNLQKPYDYKVDIYSLGLIFFELLVPFSTEMERYDFLSRIRKLNFPNLFVDTHPEEHRLIERMVSHRPDKRPDTSEVKQWLKQRIETLQCAGSGAISTLRSKSFPSPAFVDEIVKASHQQVEDKQMGKQFYKAHSFQ